VGVYLISRWSPQRKGDFYGIHRFLGAATLILALISASIGWASEQTYLMVLCAPNMAAFVQRSEAYLVSNLLIPVMGMLLLALTGFVLLTFTVFEQQAIPVDRSPNPEEGEMAPIDSFAVRNAEAQKSPNEFSTGPCTSTPARHIK